MRIWAVLLDGSILRCHTTREGADMHLARCKMLLQSNKHIEAAIGDSTALSIRSYWVYTLEEDMTS